MVHASLFVFSNINIVLSIFFHLPKASKPRQEPNSFVRDFSRILSEPALADVTFTFSREPNKQVTAHRNILFARCPHMRSLLIEKPTSSFQSQETAYFVEIDAFSSEVFQHFLRIIYTGTTNKLEEFPISTLFQLVRISLHFKLPGFASLCEDWIEKQLELKKAIPIYSQSLLTSPRLQKASLFLIIKNFPSLKEELHRTLSKEEYQFIKQIYKEVI